MKFDVLFQKFAHICVALNVSLLHLIWIISTFCILWYHFLKSFITFTWLLLLYKVCYFKTCDLSDGYFKIAYSSRCFMQENGTLSKKLYIFFLFHTKQSWNVIPPKLIGITNHYWHKQMVMNDKWFFSPSTAKLWSYYIE